MGPVPNNFMKRASGGTIVGMFDYRLSSPQGTVKGVNQTCDILSVGATTAHANKPRVANMPNNQPMGRPADLSRSYATVNVRKENNSSKFWSEKSFLSKQNSRIYGESIPEVNHPVVANRGSFKKETQPNLKRQMSETGEAEHNHHGKAMASALNQTAARCKDLLSAESFRREDPIQLVGMRYLSPQVDRTADHLKPNKFFRKASEASNPRLWADQEKAIENMQ